MRNRVHRAIALCLFALPLLAKAEPTSTFRPVPCPVSPEVSARATSESRGIPPEIQSIDGLSFLDMPATRGPRTPTPTRGTRTQATLVVNTCSNISSGGNLCLQDAITQANILGGPVAITFAPAMTGCVIQPSTLTRLPTITANRVTINGDVNGDNVPDIRISGASAGAGAEGINVQGSECVLNGLYVCCFSNRGILISGGTQTKVTYCTLGAANTMGIEIWSSQNEVGPGVLSNSNSQMGLVLRGPGAFANWIHDSQMAFNGQAGIGIDDGAHANTIGPSNILSKNPWEGVHIEDGSDNNEITNNKIGTNGSGSGAAGNTQSGIAIAYGVSGTNVHDNVISGNGWSGVQILSSGSDLNIVRNNLIGLSASGATAIPNGQYGVVISDGASSNTVGPGNTISSNVSSGVGVYGNTATSEDNVVRGNRIGTDLAGTAIRANTVHGIRVFLGATGTILGPGNVVAGNGQNGIIIDGATTTGTTLEDDRIGMTAAGGVLANQLHAIELSNGSELFVHGGDVRAAGNSSNSTVKVSGGATLEIAPSTNARLTVGGAGPSGAFDPALPSRLELRAEQGATPAATMELSTGTFKADIAWLEGAATDPATAEMRGNGIFEGGEIQNGGRIKINGPFTSSPYYILPRTQLWVQGSLRNLVVAGIEGVVQVDVGPNAIYDSDLPIYVSSVLYAEGAFRFNAGAGPFDVADRFNAIRSTSLFQGRFRSLKNASLGADKLFGLNYRRDGSADRVEVIVLNTPRLASGAFLGPGSATGRELVLSTHGWQPGGDAPTDWPPQLAADMEANKKRSGVDIASFDWTDYASSVKGPTHVANIALDLGESLAHWVKDALGNRYVEVHVSGHSAGTWVAEGFIDKWKQTNPSGWAHLSLWDAYNPKFLFAVIKPGGTAPVIGASADYAEHFVDMGYGLVLGTNDLFPNCVNIDLSAIRPPWSFSHKWPWVWYQTTAQYPVDETFPGTFAGYPHTLERSGARPSHLDLGGAMARGRHLAVYPDRSIREILGYITFPNMPPIALDKVISPTGSVTFDGTGVTLTTGPAQSPGLGASAATTSLPTPAYITMNFDLTQRADMFQCDIGFLSAASRGTLTIFADADTVVSQLEVGLDSAGIFPTGLIRLRNSLAAGRHSLQVRIDPTDTTLSTQPLENMNFSQEQQGATVSVEDGPRDAPGHGPYSTSIGGFTPNPSRADTRLTFSVANDAEVALTIYGADGRLVRRIAPRLSKAGPGSILWDGRDDGARNCPPGLYFARIDVNRRLHQIRRIVRLR